MGETTHTDNKDREKEEKVGLLVYLGQDTNELTGERSWWEKIPEDRKKTARDERDNTTEVVSKAKAKDDPLADIRKHLGCDGVRKYMREDKSKREKMAAAQLENNGDRGGREEKKQKKRKRKRSRSTSSSSSSS